MDRDYGYVRNDYSRMMERSRRESVNRDAFEARKREIRAQRKKKARRVYRIQGAILAVAIMATSYFTIPNVVDAWTPIHNDSYTAGAEAVINETHRTDDYRNFWFDYADIADEFDPETMDFDSFVYGSYIRIAGSGSGRTQINMNDLFAKFYSRGYTRHQSFDAYCLAHGCAEVNEDGEVRIDYHEYSRLAKEYIQSLKEAENIEERVSSFRGK